ncbi:MAG: cation:dicarboxylase symporter family transporter [Pseudomonadota bacterium]
MTATGPTTPAMLSGAAWHRHVLRFLLVGSLAAVGLAVVVSWAFPEPPPLLAAALPLLGALLTLWTTALLLLSLPLIVVFLIRSLLLFGVSRALARIGASALVAHVVIATILFWTIALLNDVLLPRLVTPTPALLAAVQGGGSTGELAWATPLASVDAVRATASRAVLPVVLTSLAAGLVLAFALPGLGQRLASVLDRLGARLLDAVYLLLIPVPLLLFGLAMRVGGGDAVEVIGALVAFVIYECVLIVAVGGLFYGAAAVIGGLGIRRFASAMGPVYLAAASSRSSYACIALTTEAAERTGHFDPRTVEASIPLFQVCFRSNRVFTSLIMFQFLALCFGLELDRSIMVAFYLLAVFASIGSPGLPRQSRFTTLPMYVAAGVPTEAYLFVKSTTEDIPDVFKTLLNVTYPVVLLAILQRLLKLTPQPQHESGG